MCIILCVVQFPNKCLKNLTLWLKVENEICQKLLFTRTADFILFFRVSVFLEPSQTSKGPDVAGVTLFQENMLEKNSCKS